MNNIQNYIKNTRSQEIDDLLNKTLKELEDEGLQVEFGKIGLRTNYALIYNEDHSIEIVGYTFLKDLKFYKENVGKLKALQQAIARKHLVEEEK